jgi:hypothetical protein
LYRSPSDSDICGWAGTQTFTVTIFSPVEAHNAVFRVTYDTGHIDSPPFDIIFATAQKLNVQVPGYTFSADPAEIRAWIPRLGRVFTAEYAENRNGNLRKGLEGLRYFVTSIRLSSEMRSISLL